MARHCARSGLTCACVELEFDSDVISVLAHFSLRFALKIWRESRFRPPNSSKPAEQKDDKKEKITLDQFYNF
jgi:hypothetical protein